MITFKITFFAMYTKMHCPPIGVWFGKVPERGQYEPCEMPPNHKWLSSKKELKSGGGEKKEDFFL